MKTSRPLQLLSLSALSFCLCGFPAFASAGEMKVIVPPGSRSPLDSTGSLIADRGSYLVYQVPAAALTGLSRVNGLSPRPDFDRIKLNRETIDTAAGAGAVPPALAAAEDGDRLMLVQFSAPPVDSDLALVERAGARIVQYVPQNAYIVWVPAAAAPAVKKAAGDPAVQFYGSYHPYYALSPRLDGAQGEAAVTVQFYNYGRAARAAAGRVAADAIRVIMEPTEVPGGRYINVRAVVSAGALASLAALPGVVTVEPFVEPQLFGERQDQVIAGSLNPGQTGPSGPGYLAWLAGRGFPTDPAEYPIIDVVDDGFDTGNAANPGNTEFRELNSPVLPSRCVYAIIAAGASGFGPEGLDGHGNINCSIVGGFNNGSGTPGNVDIEGYHWGLGVSPYGRIASTRIFGPSGWSYPDEDLMVSNQYAAGVRTTSNSWGADVSGAYDTDAQAYDRRTRDAQSGTAGNQEMLFVFAAGNDGPGSGSIGTPGTAKNVITVGASENDDYVLNYEDGCYVSRSGADNIQDIIDFSSRGPCDDSRVKPEIVAPGTHIHGAASYYAGYTGDGVCDMYNPAGQTKYAESSGTSHSTPAVSGFTSLIAHFLSRVHGITDPSPALRKALVVLSSRHLTGVDANDNLPSNNQGFGLINLDLAFDGAASWDLLDQTEVLHDSGDTYQTTVTIDESAKPLRIALVWTDEPGPTSGAAYVNDLDLEVQVGGSTYLGNNFTLGVSQTGGSADPRNNTECVFLPSGFSGAVTITVRGTTIAGDGVPGNGDDTDQDFALAVYNVQAASPTPTPVGYRTPILPASPSPTPALCTQLDVRFDGFDSGTRPAGWTFAGCDQNSDTYTTAGDYGAGSPSLKLDTDGDRATSAVFEGGEWLQFWVKGQSADVSSSLLVEEEYYSSWEPLVSIQPLPAAGRLYTDLALNPSSTQVRFTYNKSVGDLALDDILVKCVPSPTPFGFKTPTPNPTATPPPSATPPPTPPPTPVGWQVFLYEDFEEEWPGWTEQNIIGTEQWWQAEGADLGPDGIPPAAYEGTYNALFYYDDFVTKSTRLISPRIQIPADASGTTLTFWHTQGDWEGDWDTMIVYYRTSAGGAWQQLASYQSAVNTWTQRQLSLPQASEDYYISFVPTTNYGFGVCIDAVEVGGVVGPTPIPVPTAAICTRIDERFDGFDTGTRPIGWTFTGCDQNTDTYTTAGDYGAGSPSIKLDTDGDRVTSAAFSEGDWLQFWVKGQGTDSTSSLLVEEEYYVGWVTLAEIQPLPSSGRLYTGLTLNPSSTQVRFTYNKSVGELALDDVMVSCSGPTPVPPETPTPVPPVKTPTPVPPVKTPTPVPPVRTPTPIPPVRTPTPTPVPRWIHDYDGDGVSDIAIFRPGTGLWTVRGLTRLYFGASSDLPVPGDYRGDGTTIPAVFRPATGLWAARGLSRVYFGASDDLPRPFDYNGDGRSDFAVFRPATGLWAVRGLTRAYFGASDDLPIPGYYSPGPARPAIFRPATGLWVVRSLTRLYFGNSSDTPVPGGYSGNGEWGPAIFRSASGLWAVRGVTRLYFGASDDTPVPGCYGGGGADDPAIFRPATGLWAIRGLSRAYFGQSGDIPTAR